MRVLHFYHRGYFTPIRSGADVVASSQLEYFRHKGWQVDCLLPSCPDRSHQAEAFRERYPWVRSLRLVDPPGGDVTFPGRLASHLRIARSEGFRQAAREGHDLFLTSDVSTAPLLEPLPRGCKRLLEALDGMSDPSAPDERDCHPVGDPLARAREGFLRDVAMELYGLFDGVLFLDEQEGLRAEAEHPGRIHLVPAMLPWEIRPGGMTGRDPAPAEEEEPFDLLFVASAEPPNVRGLTAFYRQVFVPYLRKHRVRLAVVGRVCDRLDFDDWYVTRFGFVGGDLEEYYARSKVIVIPLLEGRGLSIKTLEGLARGRAVVTSPAGARGLPVDPEAFLQVDMGADPRGTAAAILDLLASASRRQRMQAAARAYYRAHFGRERYFSTMDRVMAALGLAA